MTKELFVSSSPHETKIAVLEDDQLVEVYFERESSVGLVGGIYKGRVNRVLPGMQSAFVNIGLERDAFLYVSDFVEDEEEYDKIFTDAEARASKFVEARGAEPAPAAPPAPAVPGETSQPPAAETKAEAPASDAAAVAAPPPVPPPTSAPPSRSPEQGEFQPREHRGRGRFRHRGRNFRSGPRHESQPQQPTPSGEVEHGLQPLPGESLAKYRDAATSPPAVATPELHETAESPLPTAVTAPAETGDAVAPPAFEPMQAPVEPKIETSAADQGPKEARTEIPSAAVPETERHREVVDSESTVIFAPLNVFGSSVSGAPHLSGDEVEAAPPSEQSDSLVEEPSTPDIEPDSQADLEAQAESPDGQDASEGSENGDATTMEEEAQPAETASEESTGQTVPPPGGEKSYTLREPHERPKFAPRRRRGRRGGMGRSGERPPRAGSPPPVQISDVLKEGQEIIVQIAKEPLGTKGARITSHVALPGRYLVYMPTISHIGVSRKIGSEEERLRLRNIILENRGSLTGGFIVRTAGAGRSEEEFKTDLRFLSTLWNDIRTKADRVKAPALLHRDLNLVQRILRDILSPDFKQVRVDNEMDYERCVEFVNQSQPSLVGHIKLYTRKTPIFEEFGVQREIDQALKPKVWLKSGGYIVINQTEALIAVDVNTGKFVGKTNRLEDTILKTNIDAINEIVRQIRLRDLGGIIVIDFIDMDERKNRSKVVQALEEALRRDRAPTKVISFNDFGLVAITRKRVKQSLERTLCQPCTYCSGAGWVKSVTTVCYEILGEVKKMAAELEGDTITLRVHPDVAQAMKSKQGALLSEIETLTRKDVIIKGDPAVHQERFEIY